VAAVKGVLVCATAAGRATAAELGLIGMSHDDITAANCQAVSGIPPCCCRCYCTCGCVWSSTGTRNCLACCCCCGTSLVLG
jgi:hypothetical protein